MMATIDPSGTVAPGFEGYLTDMLNRAWGLSQEQFTPYPGQKFAYETTDPTTGKVSAGYSPLEEQAFKGIGGLGQYQPTTFNTGLGPVGSVQDYMNPYLQNVVDIQAREARRQADIGRNAEQARLAQAGAYGGSRQAIMEAERQRNLGTQIGDIQEKGLMAAYDQAQKQRLAESTLGLESQRLGELSKQFGVGQDLKTLDTQLKAGTIQRGIEQAPLDFGYQQFAESQNYPYKQLSFMRDIVSGMPINAQPYSPGTSTFGNMLQGGLGGLAFYNMLMGKGT
jgi:hypothetical protein